MSLRLAAFALCTLAFVAGACGRAAPRRPNLLIVVIDTLRADRLGAYGNPRGLTPFMDGLAKRGALFERAYSVSSWTIPSVASLFTARYPSQHRVVTFGSRLADAEVTIAERLHDAGWVAGGSSANPNLRTDWGYAQGFAELWADLAAPAAIGGDALRAHGLAWLDRTWHRDSSTPAMLFFQYMEPHAPYEPAEPFRSRFASDDAGKPFDLESAGREALARALRGSGHDPGEGLDVGAALRAIAARGTPLTKYEMAPLELLYDAEVATADDQIRRLFAELEQRGFLENALVVLTADHGEEFYEHGSGSHGKTLYEECVRVPLIVVGPGVPAGRRVANDVSLVDVAPTLLDLLGLAPESRFEGRSLVPLLRGKATTAGPDIVMQLEPEVATMDQRVHVRALLRGERKLLLRVDGGSEIYDLKEDPGETRRGEATLAAETRAMTEALTQVEGRLGQRTSVAAPPAPLDEATRRRLKALGYTF